MILVNRQSLPLTTFPDGTSQVWKLDEELLRPGSKVSIDWDFSHEAEFMHLAQLKDLLDRYLVNTELAISFLPYARQDKQVDNATTFGLVTFARLLNSLNFPKIIINDPHSEMAVTLIKNATAIYPFHKVSWIAHDNNIDLICYPDEGARTKYSKVYPFARAWIHGDKVRDQLTGQITSYTLTGDVKGKKVLIVDDICDGGATFTILAKDLLAKGAESVLLFVTHGIFSKGTRPLFDAGISRVFTTSGEVGPRFGSKQF